MGKLKEKFFKKVMEKPINDLLQASYNYYLKICNLYEINNKKSFEEYATCINNELNNLYMYNSSVKGE